VLRAILAFLLVPGAVVTLIFLAWPVPRPSGDFQRHAAIHWAAQHLVSLQNPDGGWGAQEGEASRRGSRAVVGRAVLWASNATGSREHREAALTAAETLLDELGRAPASALALDGVFLEEVGRFTGREEFRRAAFLVHRWRRAVRGWKDGTAAAESFLQAAEGRGQDAVRDRNLAVWRGLADVQLAVLVGEMGFAEEMARALVRGLELDPDAPAGVLAAGRAAEVLEGLPGDPLSGRVDEWLGRLHLAQAFPGVVPGDGAGEFVYAQDASHALLAFSGSRDGDLWGLAEEGARWFVDCQLRFADGSWAPVLAMPGHSQRALGTEEAVGVTADVLLALSRIHCRRGLSLEG